MRKIPTLFRRNNQTHQVDPAITPGCEWVLRGEGRATRKVDGTGVLLRAGTAYKRREVKPGRPAPDGFELVEQDPVTKKQFGWIPIDRADPSDRYHVEAIANLESDWRTPGPDGDTYELVGPKVQQNTEQLEKHRLIRHDDERLIIEDGVNSIAGMNATEAFDALKTYLQGAGHEGVVWHHPDGRRAKLKRRDFGLPWPVK